MADTEEGRATEREVAMVDGEYIRDAERYMEARERMADTEDGEATEGETAIEGEYIVDKNRGMAKIPAEIDRLGKIQIPKWVRERLGIREGAEIKLQFEVVKKRRA